MSSSGVSPIAHFFGQYQHLGFYYRPSKSANSNFNRLCKVAGWGKKSDDLFYARKKFKMALINQFHFTFGTGNDLLSWQKFCTFIDITPVPGTITECKKRVKAAHINIIDLLECSRTGKPVQKFPTVEKLSKYTVRTKRVFPKGHAKGLLKDLLREIFAAYQESLRRGTTDPEEAPAQSWQ